MSVTTSTSPQNQFVVPEDWTAADLQMHLGGIPLQRIRLVPPPGIATERDLERISTRGERKCELIDATLVEKAVGFLEGRIAMLLAFAIQNYLIRQDLGIVNGPDGSIRLSPEQIRVPDVAFYEWRQFPDRKMPSQPFPDLVPDLAIEILSKSNTSAEMTRKVGEYFAAGSRLVWLIDPERREARVFKQAQQCEMVTSSDWLDGGAVLPGFRLSLGALLDEAAGDSTNG